MTSSSTNDQPQNSPDTKPHPEGKSARWWLRKILPTALFLAVGLLLIVLVGLAQRVGWIQSGTSTTASTSDGGKETTYTCPMHPQIRQPKPGRCPICGMELVPAAKKGPTLMSWR
ncbi:heavy metal-binding domain-containing protein [Gimesia benthica]|uniref:heavy metal-binding domain-containing protein n=1 Tax=Gimesia benthica TaxID=2608982 RepID=UPI001D148DA3|nr:heavy metal-binding domain-containing protein [Gimesia benthica]